MVNRDTYLRGLPDGRIFETHTPWIPVEEELPRNDTMVLAWNGAVRGCLYMGEKWYYGREFLNDVTHWMYLPLAPDKY